MIRSRKFLLGLLVLSALCLQSLLADGGITLTESEYQTLRTTLQKADEQLTISEQTIGTLKLRLDESLAECGRLTDLLKTQDEQLETLTKQLNEASQSLRKLKNEASWNGIKMVIVGVAGIALGGVTTWLIMGGFNAHI